MEGFYSVHINIRKLHDNTYQKIGWYKKYSDTKYSSSLHKATFSAFILSFVIFQGFQLLFPYLNLVRPNVVQAGSTIKTWTTTADFQSATTNSNVDLTPSADNVSISSSAASPNTYLFWDGASAPSGWDIVSDSVGEPFYQKLPRGAASFGATGGADTHSHTLSFVSSSTDTALMGYCGVAPTAWRANGGHAHSGLSAQTVASESNLPSYRNLKVIKYSGVPSSVPAGAITIFDTGSLPANWTQYAVEDNYFVRGDAAISTGGQTTHTHSLDITTNTYNGLNIAPYSGCSGSTYKSAHTHSGTGTSDSKPNEPANIAIVLAKADNATSLPPGAIGMFDNNPSGWAVLSGTGGAFQNKFIKGSATYGATAGQDSHNHGNSTITTGIPTGTTYYYNNPTAIDNYVSPFSTHNIGVSFSTDSAIPPYVNVIFAKKISGFQTPATLGGIATGDIGLRIDAGEGAKPKASSLTWNGTTASAGQKILFKVRAGDTQAELDTNQCYGPVTLDSGCADWTTADKFFSQINGSSNSGTGIPSAMAAKRYLEVLVRLESDGSNTPTLYDVTLTYDTLESPTNSNIILTNGTTNLKDSTGATITGGVAGAFSNSSTLRVTANGLTCTNCAISPTNLRPEVEIKPVETAFDGTTGLYAASSGNSYVDIPSLTPGTGYHLQVRSIDDQGRVSGWTSYGGNADPSDIDFKMLRIQGDLTSLR
jgi:hypothetical protein